MSCHFTLGPDIWYETCYSDKPLEERSLEELLVIPVYDLNWLDNLRCSWECLKRLEVGERDWLTGDCYCWSVDEKSLTVLKN